MFKKYNVYKFGSGYGVCRRSLLFFRKRLYHTKITLNPLNGDIVKTERNKLLLFKNAEHAMMEIDHIHYGGEVISKTFKDGKVFTIRREYHKEREEYLQGR